MATANFGSLSLMNHSDCTTIDPDKLEFVDPVPDYFHLKCPICFSLLLPDAPRLTDCCGNHFCVDCIRKSLETTRQCPLCKEDGYHSISDKNHLRASKALKVLCTKKQLGCAWAGDLGRLIVHLSREGDCKHVMFDCVNKCGAQLCRLEIYKHENTCPEKRPPSLPLPLTCTSAMHLHQVDAQLSDITHLLAMIQHQFQTLNLELDEYNVFDTYGMYGGDVYNDTDHDNGPYYDHLDAGIPTTPRRIRPRRTRPFSITVADVERHSRHKFTSHQFYYGRGYPGYTFQACIWPTGHGTGSGTHLSIYLQLCFNRNNDRLLWPFNGKLTLRLVDQWSAHVRDFEEVLDFSCSPGECKKKPLSHQENDLYGFDEFIAIDALRPCHLVNDKLIIKIPEIQIPIY